METNLLNEGFRYLGFFLKPNSYGIKDWKWLIDKVEKRILFWCNRFLSKGGKDVLINSILGAIPVYWMGECKDTTGGIAYS